MLQEKLIELVRENVVLYDMVHKKYSDVNYKEKLWDEIGKELKETASNCKKTWAGLRDSYRRAIKRKKEAKSGQAATKYKKWKFEEEMSFLDPYMAERATKTSLNVDLTEDLTEQTIENESRIQENTEEEQILSETNNEISSFPELNCLPSSSKYCKKAKGGETASSILMQYLIEEQKKEKKENSSIKSFFLSIADTVEKFSSYNQHKAKSRIFSIVSEIEYEELSKNNSQFRPISSEQSHASNSWEYDSETSQATNSYVNL